MINFIKTKLIKYLFKVIPAFLRYKIIRAMININFKPDSRLTFKMASNKQELSDAFKILHDEYVRQGYMNPHPSGMRITIYHALPETTTLIALWEKEVIGTVSIIRRTGLKLPLESIFDISDVLNKESNCVEISALAIKKGFQKQRGEILFPLLKFLTEYCREYLDVKMVLMAVNPKAFDFYAALAFFKYLSRKVSKYAYVNNVPAVAGYLDLSKGYQKAQVCYNKKVDKRNLYKYFNDTRLSNFEFPERKYYTTAFPVMTPALLRYFFLEQSKVFSFLTKREYDQLSNIYSSRQYVDILPKFHFDRGEVFGKLSRNYSF